MSPHLRWRDLMPQKSPHIPEAPCTWELPASTQGSTFLHPILPLSSSGPSWRKGNRGSIPGRGEMWAGRTAELVCLLRLPGRGSGARFRCSRVAKGPQISNLHSTWLSSLCQTAPLVCAVWLSWTSRVATSSPLLSEATCYLPRWHQA